MTKKQVTFAGMGAIAIFIALLSLAVFMWYGIVWLVSSVFGLGLSASQMIVVAIVLIAFKSTVTRRQG